MTKSALVFLTLLAITSLHGFASFILGEGVDIPTLWTGNMKLAYSYYQLWLPSGSDSGHMAYLNSGAATYKLGLGQSWAVGLGVGGGFEQAAKPVNSSGERQTKMIGVGRLNLYGRWNFWNEDLGSKAGVQFGTDIGTNNTRTDLLNGMGLFKGLLVWGTPTGNTGSLNANLGFGIHPAFTHHGSAGGGLWFAALGYDFNPSVLWHFPLEAAYAVEKNDFDHPDLNLAFSVVYYFNQDFSLTAGGRYMAQCYMAEENHQLSPYAEVSMDLR